MLSYTECLSKGAAGAAVDSRSVVPGNLFFALKGERTDGHAFLEEAARKGAFGAVVSQSYKGDAFGLPLFPVPDVLAALQQMAESHVRGLPLKTVGVTGSVAKTTTKEFIAAILNTKFALVRSPGNANSQIGLPLSILNGVRGDEEVLVQEMGMTEAGQIAKLTEILPPHVAVLTAVALVHAHNFSSIREIAHAKGEIFTHPQTQIGILSRDIPHFDEVAAMGSCSKISYSMQNPLADYYWDTEGNLFVEGKLACHLNHPPVLGAHNRHNALAAIAVARVFGMSWGEIDIGVQRLILPERRLERIEKGGITFINDAYNASEISMKAAFAALPKPKGKTIAVLGEMLELGKFSEECHNAVGKAALAAVDRVVCFGKGCQPIADCFRQEGRQAPLFTEFPDVLEAVREMAEPGDVVLLKGSCGKQLWRVVEEF